MGEPAENINPDLGNMRALDKDLRLSLKRDMKSAVTGGSNSLTRIVLSSVVEGRYSVAIDELRLYEDLNNHIPIFKEKSSRFFSHAEELIRTIDSKVKFADSATVTRSQRHDLYTMVRKHFRALHHSLTQIETIENNIKIRDFKSTIWSLKALLVCGGIVIAWAAYLEGFRFMGGPIANVVEKLINDFIMYVFKI